MQFMRTKAKTKEVQMILKNHLFNLLEEINYLFKVKAAFAHEYTLCFESPD